MSTASPFVTLTLLLATIVGLQVVRERQGPSLASADAENVLYVRSNAVMQRAALSFQSLAADLYWIRAVQHYGRTKLSADAVKRYDLLYPLLDLTTTLDPRFDIAYRFGAIFLAEKPPGGPGRADQAIALLEKGLREQPDRWEFAQDIGFVHYWAQQDYQGAAEWFRRASEMPHAPNWMAPLAAVTLAEGGSRDSSRRLWGAIMDNADADWIRAQGRLRLRQLDAMDQIDALERLVAQFQQRAGARPASWNDLVRTGLLRGIPIDSERHPFILNPYWGTVSLDPASPLNPLPSSDRTGR